jgi:HPt (histidine-containing phosphotransfer) domain-containing protein
LPKGDRAIHADVGDISPLTLKSRGESMAFSPPSNGVTTQSGRSSHKAWSPPLFLLETASGDDAIIADLVDAFSRDTSARIQKGRAALAAFDFPRIRMEAHTIRGGARQVGADAVADACQELEIVCNLQEALVVAARLNHLQELCEEIRGAMASYCSSRSLKPAVPALGGVASS